MFLRDCNHCAASLPVRGNRIALLLGRSYFCPHCGHPGPSLKQALGRRLRRGQSDEGRVRLGDKETPVPL